MSKSNDAVQANKAANKKQHKTSFAVPFTQFDWGDYSTDTDYLDFKDHGTYWNLLKRYYTTGPFPNDLDDLYKKTRCPFELRTSLTDILNDFFYLSEDDDCWHHKRCDQEIQRAKGTSEVQSKRARKGMLQKARDPITGAFISSALPAAKGSYPATAGDLPAIQESRVKIQKERIQEGIIGKDNSQEQRAAAQEKITKGTEVAKWFFKKPDNFPEDLSVVYFANCEEPSLRLQSWSIYKKDGSFSLVRYSKGSAVKSIETVYKSPKQGAWFSDSGKSLEPSEELLNDLDVILACYPERANKFEFLFSKEFDEYRRSHAEYRKAKFNDSSN